MSEPDRDPLPAANPAPSVHATPASAGLSASSAEVPHWGRLPLWLLFALALVSLGVGVSLWSRLGHVEQQLARSSTDASTNAIEARAIAKQAQETVQDLATRQAALDAKVGEVALQRAQLDNLVQNLSSSRDDSLVNDLDSEIHLAQQQAQASGSVEPLLAALKSADQRLSRAAQPRFNPLQRAIAKDTERIKATAVADTPALLSKLDDLIGQVDSLPLTNGPKQHLPAPSPSNKGHAKPAPEPAWWQQIAQRSWAELHDLVRISQIADPEATLLAPDQGYFLRENLKLRLLNARMGLLSHQTESSRADLQAAANALAKYFDTNAASTQASAALLQQILGQMKNFAIPTADNTIAALNNAALTH